MKKRKKRISAWPWKHVLESKERQEQWRQFGAWSSCRGCRRCRSLWSSVLRCDRPLAGTASRAGPGRRSDAPICSPREREKGHLAPTSKNNRTKYTETLCKDIWGTLLRSCAGVKELQIPCSVKLRRGASWLDSIAQHQHPHKIEVYIQYI